MLSTLVKYCSIIICSFYIYLKLLNNNISKQKCLKFALFLLFFLPTTCLLRKYAAPLTIIVMVVAFSVFISRSIKNSLSLSLTVSTISFGLSYLAYLVAAAITSIIGYSFLLAKTPLTEPITFTCASLIQILLSTIPFRFKRLKKGMPFLIDYGSHDVGVYMSILLLFAFSFFGISEEKDPIFLIPAFLSLACGLTLLFWWRQSISKNYLEKVKAKELEELQVIIQGKDAELEQLKYHNSELSKIIHKDNKLIPAMEYAVREYLLSAESETEIETSVKRAKELLEQLESMTRERSGILNTYEHKNKVLPSTNVPSIDTLMSYMLQKSNGYQIEFDLTVSGSVKYLVQNILDETDLRTLLADFMENAIIATKQCERRKILVHIGIVNEIYTIDVFDSGISFTAETLLHIGQMRFTTHKKDGGSGIGLMSTFEIARKYQSSFIIEELDSRDLFVKKVSMCFDQLGQYRVKTSQAENVHLLSRRNDVILIDDSKPDVEGCSFNLLKNA